jgi:hypothetical protein
MEHEKFYACKTDEACQHEDVWGEWRYESIILALGFR